MEQLNIKHECKRYGCAVLAATVFAINIKTFVRAGGLYPGGVSGLTLLIQNIFAQFLGLQIPYTVINILLNSIPVYVGFRFIGKKFTISSCCVILLSSVLTDLIPAQPITYDSLLISIFGGLINGFSISLCLIGNTSSGGTDLFFRKKRQRYLELCFLCQCLHPCGRRYPVWLGPCTVLHYFPVHLHPDYTDASSALQEAYAIHRYQTS